MFSLILLLISSFYNTSASHLSKYEEIALINAKRLILQKWDPPQKPLLCVTFMSLRKENCWHNLLQNVKYAKEHCEWLVVSYNSVDDALLNSRVAAIEEVARSANTAASVKRHSFGSRDGLLKPLLFETLLPHLKFYSKVWLMDEDISITSFNFRQYFGIWNCAFDKASPPPLVSQPLINGNKLTLPFVKDGWAMYKNAVIAIQYVWIEQQTPILDARFFSWFIPNFIFPLKQNFIESKSDFGYDQTWCGAAQQWNQLIHEATPRDRSTENVNNPPCVVIMADNYVDHKDFRTITDWHVNKSEWLNRSKILVAEFKKKFPHFYFLGFKNTSFHDKQRWFSKASGTCKQKPFLKAIPDVIVDSPQIRREFRSYAVPFTSSNNDHPSNQTNTNRPSNHTHTNRLSNYTRANRLSKNMTENLTKISSNIMTPTLDSLRGHVGSTNGTAASMPRHALSRENNAADTLRHPVRLPSNGSVNSGSIVTPAIQRCARYSIRYN